MIKACNRIIEYSFYCLFLLVPLVFTSATSELFELNKMWLTWGLTIIIGAAWLIKMVLQKKIIFQRTPLDILIGLFLASQVISTIFSLDSHVSLWGYYSRFNGGLLSILSFVLLYYAFLSNFISENSEYSENQKIRYSDRQTVRQSGSLSFPSILNNNPIKMVKRLLGISLISGLIVALWGLPSHFGYDPTCFLFRGTLDVSCWTADFMPTIRIFSTLGQPDWLAAYLAILIPISIAMALGFQKTQITQKSGNSDNQTVRFSDNLMHRVFRVFWDKQFLYILFAVLFYVDLLYTRARSGFLGIWISLIFFFAAYFFFQRKSLKSSIINHSSFIIIGSLLLITFVIGTPINQFNKFTLSGIGSYFQKVQAPKIQSLQSGGPARLVSERVAGGTESANIRLNVWTGAINIWRANPLFGTGVETFAFAYYKYKPVGQNLTSEWNFLYNKAHNEYLNYLATTGIFGLGSYLAMIGAFLFMAIKKLLFSENSEHSENQKFRQSDNLNVRKPGAPSFPSILNVALIASYVSILITNFFGFSVVITNIYLFMIPAFVFVLTGMLPKDESRIPTSSRSAGLRGASKNYESRAIGISLYQWAFVFFIILASLFMILSLFRFWRADIAYALGYNLDRAGEYQEAYPNLHKAVELRRNEPVFKDELSYNNAVIAAGLLAQKPEKTKDQAAAVASNLIQEAINTNNEVISQHPNNAVFWKTRTRLFYSLSQVDSQYLPRALDAIVKASLIAPNDANIWYNLGVLYGQNNNLAKGISALEKTIKLRPDYRDAHYALGLFYRTASQNTKAISEMRYILDHLNPADTGALESLTSWGKL